MEFGGRKVEASLRLCAVLLLILNTCLVALDSETKIIFYVKREATFKYLRALIILVCAASIAAAYNLFQLVRICSFQISSSAWFKFQNSSEESYKYLAWLCYLLDQIAVYAVFAMNSAAVEHSLLVVTGAKSLTWMKLCNKFTRFCFQIGGALLCAYAASGIMALISFISAYNLFRLYSPKHFLRFKGTS